LHFECERVPVGADTQTTIWNGDDPVESRRCDGRMKIMNLIRGGNLSPE
jgi:hypothetical protein